MATTRQYVCDKCAPRPAGSLFAALLNIAKGGAKRCRTCKGPLKLRLKFPFGLDAKDSDCVVTHAFVPRTIERWKDSKGRRVKFYPFLVILNRHGRKKAVWMPYWHLVGVGKSTQKKYGQWAPFMDEALFNDLLNQAVSAAQLRSSRQKQRIARWTFFVKVASRKG